MAIIAHFVVKSGICGDKNLLTQKQVYHLSGENVHFFQKKAQKMVKFQIKITLFFSISMEGGGGSEVRTQSGIFHIFFLTIPLMNYYLMNELFFNGSNFLMNNYFFVNK